MPPAGSAQPARGSSPPRARTCSCTTTAARSGRPRVAAEIGGAPIAQADLTVEDDVDRLFATAREKLGSVDVCAAVAGVWPAVDLPVWELPLARWEETIRQNLTATFLTARAFLREVARTGHGSLVLVGSTAGRFGEAGHADYAAAKSALQGGLLLSLKNEVARVAPRARVNAVAPGWTESPMTRGLVDDEAVRRISRTMALRKVAQPEDIAAQVVVALVRRSLRPRQRRARHGGRRNGRPRRPRRRSWLGRAGSRIQSVVSAIRPPGYSIGGSRPTRV